MTKHTKHTSLKQHSVLEELNTWVSNHLDPWEFLKPVLWYYPDVDKFSQGISVCFKHTCLPAKDVYDVLVNHLNEYEKLERRR